MSARSGSYRRNPRVETYRARQAAAPEHHGSGGAILAVALLAAGTGALVLYSRSHGATGGITGGACSNCSTTWLPSGFPAGGYKPATTPFTCDGVTYGFVTHELFLALLASGAGLYWAPQPCQVEPLPADKYWLGSGYYVFEKL